MRNVIYMILGIAIASHLSNAIAGETNDFATTNLFGSTNDFNPPPGVTVEFPKPLSVSDFGRSEEKRQTITVTTNDVILIKRPSGVAAVVQFSGFSPFSEWGPYSGLYRWRYSAPGQPVQSGSGEVRESYEKTSRTGGVFVTPRSDHNPTVKAGDIWIKWSYGSESQGYLYYYPSRATIQILPLDAFDKKF